MIRAVGAFDSGISGSAIVRTTKHDQWIVREVAWPHDVAATVRALASSGEIAWLDSAVSDDLRTAPARFSLVCGEPIAAIEQFDGGPAELSIRGQREATAGSGLELWRSVSQRLLRLPLLSWNLSPGWIGYVGFEMARWLERLPGSHREDLGLPLMRIGLFDRGIVFDHRERRAYAVIGAGVRSNLGLTELSPNELLDDWQRAVETKPPCRENGFARISPDMQRGTYERMVERALEYISAGDIYQVNLAQRFRIDGIGDPLDEYCRLRCVNPAPYATLLRWSDGAIGSVSPELFLRHRDGAVLTRPIKGTRPRTHDPLLDAAYRQQLLDSEKDAAELAMIIDLHRNDLGRICEFGSVRVPHARRIETHPTVFHTVADVVGRLRADRDELDLLEACFPAGSISGVPKIRALEIIDELEPVARGAYTGSVGVLGLDGQMTFNVAIRTLQFGRQAATLHVGGGIVADSDPADEYEETLAKARGVMEALGMANGELRMAKG
jgi:para-aminobenzoate synthetase component 1